MAEKKDDKQETKKAEAHEAPKPDKGAMAAQLLDLYTHNMEHAAPRTLEELRLIQQLAG